MEFEALQNIRQVNHPNVVQVLQAFHWEEMDTQTFNFIFPLALGNLKQVFRGSPDDVRIPNLVQDLWSQFEGLASGLEYTMSTAIRHTETSNLPMFSSTTNLVIQRY